MSILSESLEVRISDWDARTQTTGDVAVPQDGKSNVRGPWNSLLA